MHPRTLGGWVPSRALTAVERSEILKPLERNLRDPAEQKSVVAAVEGAVQRFVARREPGMNERPQVEAILGDLRGLQAAADAMIDAVEALGGETRAQLTEWVSNPRRSAQPGPWLAPETLQTAVDLCSWIADSTELLQLELGAAKPPLGRPRDVAARSLAYELSLIWRRLAQGPITRPRGTTRSPWFEFVKTVLRVAGAGTIGEGYARELADYWRAVEESEADSSP